MKMHRRFSKDSYDFSEDDVFEILLEGKTKRIFEFAPLPGHCIIWRKDIVPFRYNARVKLITDIMELSNTTNGQVFQLLNDLGIRTAYVRQCSSSRGSRGFIAKRCAMIPIEWVARRLADGAEFLGRNADIVAGHRFSPLKLETFYKTDVNNHLCSDEHILSGQFTGNGVRIGIDEIERIKRTTILIFEILEKLWAGKFFTLADLRVEFGVDEDGQIVLADVIDSNSWSLWPSSDKNMEFDREDCVNIVNLERSTLTVIREYFTWISEELKCECPKHLVVILVVDNWDSLRHSKQIFTECEKLGLKTITTSISGFERTENIIDRMRLVECAIPHSLFIAVANVGIAYGLEKLPSGALASPIINCPPMSQYKIDGWSSLCYPTILSPRLAALHAAQVLGVKNYKIWSKLRCKQWNDYEIFLAKSKIKLRLAENAKKFNKL